MAGLLRHLLLLHLLGATALVDEDDGAENHHLGADAQERPQRRQLVCNSKHVHWGENGVQEASIFQPARCRVVSGATSGETSGKIKLQPN